MLKPYGIFIIIFVVIIVSLSFSKAREINNLTQSPVKIPEAKPTPPQKANINIVVLSPGDNLTLDHPFLIRGRARVFENVVSIRLKNSNGEILTEGTAYANAPDVGKFGDFEEYFDYEPQAGEGILEVFQASPKDGSPIDLVRIPVKLQ